MPRRGPLKRFKGPTKRRNTTSQPKLNLVHFSCKIRHLVATNFVIFLRSNLPNFIHISIFGAFLHYNITSSSLATGLSERRCNLVADHAQLFVLCCIKLGWYKHEEIVCTVCYLYNRLQFTTAACDRVFFFIEKTCKQ